MSALNERQLIERFVAEVWSEDETELIEEIAAEPTPACPALFAYRGPDGLRTPPPYS